MGKHRRREGDGSKRGRWNGWDWIVAIWVMLLDWMFELAQWVISNVVPVFKNGTVQGAILAGIVFGCATLLLRFLRDNEREKRTAIFPLTPPPKWTEVDEAASSREGYEPEGEQK